MSRTACCMHNLCSGFFFWVTLKCQLYVCVMLHCQRAQLAPAVRCLSTGLAASATVQSDKALGAVNELSNALLRVLCH